MYQKVDKKLAVQALTDAISAFLDFGKLDKVGRIEQQLAELYEESEEKEDLEKAVEHYQKAADFFEGENQRTTANTCTQKVAHLKAMVGQYSDALVAFEKSARNAVDDKLLKYGAKDHFFKAALCAICAMENPVEELDEFKQRLEGYKDDDVNFPDSYECKLLDKIVLSMDEKNIKNFQAAVREYNNIKKLDNWKTQILLTVKEKVAKFTEADLDLT
jgi:alpha-soluble NSF attachment protein